MVKNLMSTKMQLAITVKNLIAKGVPTREIMKQLGVNKQYISYWRHKEIKETHYRKKKLPIQYIKWLVKLASNKLVSECSSRIITRILNKKLKQDKVKDNKKKQLTIGYRTVNKILNKFIGKPRKIRKVFFYQKNKKKRELNSAKWYWKRGGREKIFFSRMKLKLTCLITLMTQLD